MTLPKNRTRKSRNLGGFTLTELLIVIALIAILFIAGLIGYQLQLRRGYDALRKRDLNNIKIAFEHYYSDHGCYPPATILDNCGGPELQPYLEKIPCDPETNLPYEVEVVGVTCATKFFVYADLDDSDPAINCLGEYVVTSPNVNQSEIALNCVGASMCQAGYYGCVQGSCVLISAITQPACGNLQCLSSCGNHCGDPNWEVYPQPCEP